MRRKCVRQVPTSAGSVSKTLPLRCPQASAVDHWVCMGRSADSHRSTQGPQSASAARASTAMKGGAGRTVAVGACSPSTPKEDVVPALPCMPTACYQYPRPRQRQRRLRCQCSKGNESPSEMPSASVRVLIIVAEIRETHRGDARRDRRTPHTQACGIAVRGVP